MRRQYEMDKVEYLNSTADGAGMAIGTGRGAGRVYRLSGECGLSQCDSTRVGR